MSDRSPDTTPKPLGKGRIEAFSDGVIAIIITIMVLELKTPEGFDLQALSTLWPTFSMYVLSFVYVGIYWNNHHHMLHAAHRVSGGVMWANLHLLFWLSLVPFTTRWMGESHFATWPVAVYGASLFMPAIAYTILVRRLIAVNGRDSELGRAIGGDVKGIVSLVIYALGIALSFWQPLAGLACYVTVALVWLVPDRRIERT
ncbi:TMEM175 family protein [Asticcacaulis solisilvae]|uniref:TMEM175 family protein n=1 Tax=Asticcacaulis solisilvae TaxID=1217274 RepID=UPI003FD85CBE